MNQPAIRLQTAADLATALRGLLGYQPTERLVIVAYDGRSIAVTAAVEIDHVETLTPAACAKLEQYHLFVFGISEDPTLALTAAETFLDLVPTAPYLLHTITGGHLTSHYDTGTTTEPIPAWDTSEFAALKTYAGAVSDDSREALISRLDAVRQDDQAACAALLATATPADAADLFAAATDPNGTVTPQQAASATAALADPATYDAAMRWITRTDAPAHFEFWRRVALLGGHDRAFNLAALAGWVSGQSIWASWAIEKVTTRTGLTVLVETMLDSCTAPAEWDHLRHHGQP